jgi:hypothetical protein
MHGLDDTELSAAIGRMVVEAATLEHSAAVLVAATEGLRDEACEDRALAIVKGGEVRRRPLTSIFDYGT